MIFKKLFETPKKAVLSVLCIIAIIAIAGFVTVFAANIIAKNNSIGEKNAQNTAFSDAGIDPESVERIQTKFDYEDGTFVYDIEFIADGSEFEYLIKSSDGTIINKEIVQSHKTKNINSSENNNTSPASNTTPSVDNTASPVNNTASPVNNTASPENSSDYSNITVDDAKSIALKHANLSETEVRFVKSEIDIEDGKTVYEIEFYKDNIEYEYTIDAANGSILEFDID